jgi:hypothetical protein
MDSDTIGALTGLCAAVIGSLAVLTPVVALSARFAMRPIVDAMIRLREAQGATRNSELQDRRIALLESEIQGLQHTVRSLADAEDFRRQLAAPRPDPAPALAPADR